jgi:RNA polymerase sigma-70 factor (ECF subfamily)
VDARTTALEELYRERYAVFRNVLTGVTGDRETAREVVQEAFARALRARRSYRGDGSLEAWVWRIAIRLAVKAKPDRRLVPVDEIELEAPEARVDADLRAAVRRLPPQRRLMVFLRYFADLPYAEIAAICGVSEGTVAATLSQARGELLALLEQEVTR